MSLRRCENNHYFDPAKHTTCPSCGISGIDMPPTKLKRDPEQKEANRDAAPDKTRGRDEPGKGSGQKVTVPLVRKKTGIDPVVGWLVCVEGAERGRDYRLRSERNFVGRSEAMDVAITGDETISRENHAIVSYNPKKLQFKVHPGESRGLVYLNGEEVDEPQALKAGDRIELGQTTLLFVPLCGESFRWD